MNEDDKKQINGWILFFFILCVVLSFWFFNIGLLADLNAEERGTYGDMFGAVNSLFSGFAFAGVIIAILLQSRELKEQRKELELTREQLEGQKVALQKQNKTLIQQRFENTFFQMLSLHNEIVNSMVVMDGNKTITAQGRSALKNMAQVIQRNIARIEKEEPKKSKEIIVIGAYEHVYHNFQSYLGHYFRVLYRMIKFVDESDVDDKRIYTDIVRAQLSNQELQLLFYNCLSPEHGKKNFKPLVEEYALLDNLPPDIIYDPENTIQLYDKNAYGGEYPTIQ